MKGSDGGRKGRRGKKTIPPPFLSHFKALVCMEIMCKGIPHRMGMRIEVETPRQPCQFQLSTFQGVCCVGPPYTSCLLRDGLDLTAFCSVVSLYLSDRG